MMSGRIKLLNGGIPVSDIDEPEIPYTYETQGEFDKKCGTYGLDAFQLPNAECPSAFVCNSNEQDENIMNFSTCIDAMNCAMMVGMTSNVNSGPQAQVELFIHDMIPHHQNAVNMAKALLKEDVLHCNFSSREDEDDCAMVEILREIINGQNSQIHAMRTILANKGWPLEDDCIVNVTSRETDMQHSTSGGKAGNDVYHHCTLYFTMTSLVAVFLSFKE